MKRGQVVIIALGSVAGAFAFGVLADACIELMSPRSSHAAIEAAPAPSQPQGYDLASAHSAPVTVSAPANDTLPAKVRTVPIIVTTEPPEQPSSVLAYAPAPAAAPVSAMPRPRPASAPADVAAAKPAPVRAKPREEDEGLLSPARIERVKSALQLTPDQEVYWPAVAAELRAIGAAQPKAQKGVQPKLNVDQDSVQRLYWAAAPLITRLRDDQKRTVRQLASMMGLQEVASAI